MCELVDLLLCMSVVSFSSCKELFEELVNLYFIHIFVVTKETIDPFSSHLLSCTKCN